MTSRRTPAGPAGQVIQLPVIDVTLIDTALRAVVASVTALGAADASAEVPTPRAASAAPPCPDDRGDDDAVLVLMQSRLSYQAASAATDRVRLPSLADFLA